MSTPASQDIAYIAGLFDGEGSIYYAKRREKKKKHNGEGYRYSNSQNTIKAISHSIDAIRTHFFDLSPESLDSKTANS